jgi:hypothetical protein
MNFNLQNSKVFSLKYMLTTLAVVIVVVWVLQKIGKQTITLYDSTGKQTATGTVKYSLSVPTKKTV